VSDTTPDEETLITPLSDSGFTSFMDAFTGPDNKAPAAKGEAPSPAPTAGDGQPVSPVKGTGPTGTPAPTPTAGESGQPGVPGTPEPARGTDGDHTPLPGSDPEGTAGEAGPGVGTVDVATLAQGWTDMSTNIEKATIQTHQTAALKEVREQYPKYFETLNKHPRSLVGQKVPAASKEEPNQDSAGFVQLRDSQDAKDWQDATKQLMVEEIRANSTRRREANPGTMQSIHQSIELFQNNSDLVPNTKQFDKQLADEFVSIAEPYEVRENGKLQGYSIAVQPLINQLRTKIQETRTAAPAAAGAPGVTPSAPDVTPPAPEDGPQAGIPSKSGTSGEGQNMDTFWGTIGLSGIRL